MITEEMVKRGCHAACLHEHGSNLTEGSSLLTGNAKKAWEPFVRAILTAALSDQVGWQPIETAPKDIKFLAMMHDGREPPNLGYAIIGWNSHGRDKGAWMNSFGSEYAQDAAVKGWARPLFWQPLPAPPEPTGDNGEDVLGERRE